MTNEEKFLVDLHSPNLPHSLPLPLPPVGKLAACGYDAYP